MGKITSGIGLVSGINSKDVIDQLMRLEARPKERLQTRIDSQNQVKLAFADFTTRLTSLRLSSQQLKKPSLFAAAKATSSNEQILTGSASRGAAPGTYQFQVARLVTTQASVSAGFSSFDSSKLTAGTVTVELGGGEVTSQTDLNALNGGKGVARGVFRITDRSGKTATIDIRSAVSVQDVVKRINSSLDISVTASVTKQGLKLVDGSGGSGALLVADLSGGTAAADLGIAGSVGTNTLTGTVIRNLGRDSALAELNDGRGVRTNGASFDVRIDTADGSRFDIVLGSARTVGELFDKINLDSGGKVKGRISDDGLGIVLDDQTTGGGAFLVSDLNGSKALTDLGLTADGATSFKSRSLISGLGSTLLTSLRGGQGVTTGVITVTDRGGASTDIDLAGSTDLQDVIDKINAGSAGRFRASVNSAGNGLQVADTSGGTGTFQIADQAGQAAADLGIVGSFDSGVTTPTNLQRQWVSESTALNKYNGGKGVAQGSFKLTDSTGKTANVSVGTSDTSLGDVIKEINSRGLGIVASINANGDGLLLTDTAGGGAKLKVEDLGATTAKDLRIAGTATATTIDGSFEKTFDITATDTLATLQGKLNEAGFGVQAQIINDGSAGTPFRLSLAAKNSGRSGRVIIDSGTTGLGITNLVEGQDAAVFLGSAGAVKPLLITASSNTISGVIPGVTVNLTSASDKPVELSVTRNAEDAIAEVKKFVENFNNLATKITELTKFDTSTNRRGLLLGDSTTRNVQTEIFAAVTGAVSTTSRYRTLSDIGVKVGSGAQLEFDEDKFRTAYGTDPAAAEALFTFVPGGTLNSAGDGAGFGTRFESRINRLIDPVNGAISRQNKQIDSTTDQFQQRITQLDALLVSKRSRLEKQFASLETVLAGLQSQQSALGSIQTIRST